MAGPSTSTSIAPRLASPAPERLEESEESKRLRLAWDLLSFSNNSSPQLLLPIHSLPSHSDYQEEAVYQPQAFPVVYQTSGSTATSSDLDTPNQDEFVRRVFRKRKRSDAPQTKVEPAEFVLDQREESEGASTESVGSPRDDMVPARRPRKAISIPIPVPNLTKSSRGRKMPSTLSPYPGSGSEDGIPPPDRSVRSGSEGSSVPSGRRPATNEGRGRTYVCQVENCRKLFVRGEHLKRHVRSIHTHDKPHPCPFEGCFKTFSRRDNLNQHTRIHTNSPRV